MRWINTTCSVCGSAQHRPSENPKPCSCGSNAWTPKYGFETEADDPVGAVEIAALMAVEPSTVHMWHYRGIMPTPRWQVSGKAAWRWGDVEKWAWDTDRRFLAEFVGPDAFRNIGQKKKSSGA